MLAYVIHEFGGPEQFAKMDLPQPTAEPGQVLIRVAATSVNPVDYKIRSGDARALGPDLPARLHGDVSGIVHAVGEHVTRFKPGDAVYGCVGGVKGTQGVLADFALANERLLALAPRTIPLVDAAALPLVAITAWEGWDKCGCGENQRVLVHGGTGGVGHLALQLAKARGAQVTATVGSDDKTAIAQNLGADHVINYKNEDTEAYVNRITGGLGFDCVFDTVGGENIPRAVAAARLNGQVVCIQGRAEIRGEAFHARGVSWHLVFMLIPMLHGIEQDRHGQILTQLAAMVDDGRVRPLIDAERFTFDQIGKAHAYAESGRQIGKVLVVRDARALQDPLTAEAVAELPSPG
ncbi:MAG: zinc-binding dehydrogenase [Planctomycetota bacterium]